MPNFAVMVLIGDGVDYSVERVHFSLNMHSNSSLILPHKPHFRG